MAANVWNYFILHFLIGIGIGILNAGIFQHRKFRFFRFGGMSPFSIGDKSRWILWYIVALAFEKLSSLAVPNVYTELALSAIEAVALTIGLFLVDRVRMMFEPEEYWMPRPRIIRVVDLSPAAGTSPSSSPATPRKALVELSAPVAGDDSPPVPVELPPPVKDQRERRSWLAENLAGAAEHFGATPRSIFGKVVAAARYSRTSAGQAVRRPVEAIRQQRVDLAAARERIAQATDDMKKKAKGRAGDLTRDR